ncbi:MAG: DUF87 domain-containing protein, partial [Magnetococcales bacterium]|nr:DUF87 domain-containing protein [Magnetococcales bacterium]
MNDALTIGRVIGVHGFRVKVELEPDIKSPSRVGFEGVQTAVAINAYLTFDIGAGELAIGVVTDLEARESFDPSSDDELTLELVKPRRTASVQLLGTVKPKRDRSYGFDPGITVLPSLETPARTASRDVMQAAFSEAPKRNAPGDAGGRDDYDIGLNLGIPTANTDKPLLASFNDLFSRPMAIVGNTGSGKSFTVARLLQSAVQETKETRRPRFFVLDINGEYGRAFGVSCKTKEPNKIYLNGKEFSVPVWLMNAREVCDWLSAAGQTQEPVLKAFWSVAKGGDALQALPSYLHEAISRIEKIQSVLRDSQRTKDIRALWSGVIEFIRGMNFETGQLHTKISSLGAGEWDKVESGQKDLFDLCETLKNQIAPQLKERKSQAQDSADKPKHFPIATVRSQNGLLESVKGDDDEFRLKQHISTLQLRLNNRIADRRWGAFLNYDDAGIEIRSISDIAERMGIGQESASEVNVIDCSMLGHEVLPYVCGIIGRILLELREHVPAEDRFKDPWVLVLEEAHNYIRPRRQDEDPGTEISREAYERIAKEGRKFGLSMIVASQRPSEISPTIISQCANIIMHRLQNHEDIEHFRRIVPSQSRRLLDQITVLASGEAIVFGSAFHVPTRVRIHLPEKGKEPWSQTAAPYDSWNKNTVSAERTPGFQRFSKSTILVPYFQHK